MSLLNTPQSSDDVYQDILKEWHPTKNDAHSISQLTRGSSKKVWWICPNEHEYESRMKDRNRGRGCPYCAGKKTSKTNSLGSLYPNIASEWHPTKNDSLTPDSVTYGSNKKAWWLCKNQHEYQQRIICRTQQNQSCPYCAGKKSCKENSLFTLFPEISKQWHPIKNYPLTPNDVTKASKKKIWWICPNGHEYESICSSRTKHHGCPYCDGKKASNDNNFKLVYPEIAKEWHPIKNSDLNPDLLTKKSNRKVWWLCPKEHEYQSSLKSRANGTNCPYCSGNKVTSDNCLEKMYPEIAKDWHPKKNSPLTPKQVTVSSNRKIWWICPKGHEYQSAIYSRKNGSGCRFCSRQTSKPEIRIFTELKFLFPHVQSRKKLYGHELDIYLPELKIGIEYDGYYYHKGSKYNKDFAKNTIMLEHGITLFRFREKPLEKISPEDIIVDNLSKSNIDSLLLIIIRIPNFDHTNIEIYLNQNDYQNESEYLKYLSYIPSILPEQSLPYISPKLTNEWDFHKNFPLTPENYSIGSNQKVYWICKHNHSYKAAIKDRGHGSGCPYCAGKKASSENSLIDSNPDIIREWHPEKNLPLKPNNVTKGSGKEVWWICSVGHEYKCVISRRTYRGLGCKECRTLAFIYPEIAKEWHPYKNGMLTAKDVTRGSNKKIWWICPHGHEYKTKILSRTNGTNCPYCSGTKVCETNSLATLLPELTKEWHPFKNEDLFPCQVTRGSNKKVWWQCDHEHEWMATINNRVSKKSKCPICKKTDSSKEKN